MDYKSLYADNEILTIDNIQTEDDTSLSAVELDSDKIDIIDAPSLNFSQIDDAATSDILQNGILVETNKGLVCMSVNDILSSNVNLSEDYFHKVAAQLLLSQTLDNTHIPPDSSDSSEQIENIKLESIKPETNVPSIRNDIKTIPFSVEITYKSNLASSSDESTIITNNRNNLLIEHLNQNLNTNQEVVNNQGSENESQVFPTKDKPNVTKRRGGWPKGRKRKPELLHLPPKAPKTSYNIFLNERRKLYKDKLAFHEITRVVGNQWSSLSAEEKQPYIEKALEDKMRYKRELMAYRQSDAYKMYLARKRKKRALDNLLSESDMDGTDDFDDEPDDLYCDMCDQWFYNLHNKREHLLSRQHKMLVADDMTKELASSDSEYKGHISSVSFSTSLDESSLDAAPVEIPPTNEQPVSTTKTATENVSDFMSLLLGTVIQREKEIQVLQTGLNKAVVKKTSLMLELSSLKEKANEYKAEINNLKKQNNVIQTRIYQLLQTIFLVKN